MSAEEGLTLPGSEGQGGGKTSARGDDHAAALRRRSRGRESVGRGGGLCAQRIQSVQRAGGRKPNSICWKTGPGGRSQLCPFLSVTLASPFGALGLSCLSCNRRLPGPQRGLKARIGTSQPLEELLGAWGGARGPGVSVARSLQPHIVGGPALALNPAFLSGAEGDSAARPAVHSAPPEKHRHGQGLAPTAHLRWRRR